MSRVHKELVLCLILEDATSCDVVIQGICNGEVFGPSQPLHLVMCGSRTADLEGLCMDIEDCSFSSVRGISVVKSLSEISIVPHITMVILSNSGVGPQDESLPLQLTRLPLLIQLVSEINELISPNLTLDQKVLIVGDQALTAASLLSWKLQGLSPSQLLAIDTLEPSQVTRKDKVISRTSQYGLLSQLCATVSHWWTGPQEKHSTIINMGTKFLDTTQRSSSPSRTGYFFSTPVDIHAPLSFSVCLDRAMDKKYINRCRAEQDQAIRLLDKVDCQSCQSVCGSTRHAYL